MTNPVRMPSPVGFFFRDQRGIFKMTSAVLMHLMVGIVTLLNAIEYLLMKLINRRLLTLDKKRLVRSLEEDALEELDDHDVDEAINVNMDGLERDKTMNFFNRYAHFSNLKGQLETRAAIKAALQNNPQLSQTSVSRPVFIIGLPRTGTTLLHNLLALQPRFYAPMMWEMIMPLPAEQKPEWRKSERYLSACQAMEIHQKLSGYWFDDVHVVRADLPEECHFLLHRSLYVYYMFLCSPAFSRVEDWFYSRDHRFMLKMYNFYRSQLQIIGYGHGMESRNFLLKSHIHNMGLPALMETFPDARLIFTYRKLSDVIPSFASMVDRTTAHYGPRDPDFGKRALRLAAELANKAASSLKHFKTENKYPNQIMLLSYDDLVSKTPKTMEEVYSFLGMTLPPEMREAVDKYLLENPKNKFGRHVYTKGDFGITEQAMEASCQEYLSFIKEVTAQQSTLIL